MVISRPRSLFLSLALFSPVCLSGTAAFGAGDAPEPVAAPAAPSATTPAVPSAAAATAVSEVQALADAGRYKEATAKAQAFVAKDTGNAQMYNLLGFALRKQQQWLPSVAAYQEAIKLRPDYAQAKEYLAITYLGMGEGKAAKALHDELKSTHPKLAAAIATEAKRLKVKW